MDQVGEARQISFLKMIFIFVFWCYQAFCTALMVLKVIFIYKKECAFLLLMCFGALGWSQVVQAQQAPELEVADVVEEDDDELVIVVTGTRTQRRLEDSPVAIEVLTLRDIEQTGGRTLAEVLDEQPGLDVVPTQGGLGIRLQGLDPKYVLIMVDGQRVNGRVDGAVDLSRFSVEDIEQIEIVRGASAALYGADALGGVIHIKTRPAVLETEADATISAGERGTFDGRVGAGMRRKTWGLRLSGSWRQADAFDLDSTDVSTDGSAKKALVVAGQGQWFAVPWLKMNTRLEYLRQDLDGVDSNSAGAVFDRRNITETFSGSLQSEVTLGDGLGLDVQLSYGHFRDQFLFDQRGAQDADLIQETVDRSAQVNVLVHKAWGDHRLTLGTEGLLEWLESERLDEGRGSRQRGAALVHEEWAVTPTVALVAGARVDADSQFGLYPSPSVAARWSPREEIALRLSAGRGFRAPNFKELLLLFENPSANYLVQGNPELKPETSWNFNANAEWELRPGLSAFANVFYNNISGLISVESLASGNVGEVSRFTYLNLERAVTQGLETSVRWKPWTGARGEVSYTLTDSLDVSRDRPLPGRARHRAGLKLAQGWKPWGLDGSVRGVWNSTRSFYQDPTGSGNEVEMMLDPYVSVDARLAWSPQPSLTLFVGGDNLLDAGEAILFPISPRRLYAGLTGRY